MNLFPTTNIFTTLSSVTSNSDSKTSIFKTLPALPKYPDEMFFNNVWTHLNAPTLKFSQTTQTDSISCGENDILEVQDISKNVLHWVYNGRQYDSLDALYYEIADVKGDFWKIKHVEKDRVLYIRITQHGFTKHSYEHISFKELAKKTENMSVTSLSKSSSTPVPTKSVLFFLASFVMQTFSQIVVNPTQDQTFNLLQAPLVLPNREKEASIPNGIINAQITQSPSWASVNQTTYVPNGTLTGSGPANNVNIVGNTLFLPGPNGIRGYTADTNQFIGTYTGSTNCIQGVRNFFACGNDGVHIIDPNTLQQIAIIPAGGTPMTGVAFDSQRDVLWIIQGSNILSYSVSTPTNPTLIRSNAAVAAVVKVTVSQDKPVIFYSTSTQIQAWNVNTLTSNPVVISGGGPVTGGINDFDTWDDGSGNTFVFIARPAAATTQLAVFQQAGTSGALTTADTLAVSGDPQRINAFYPFALLRTPSTNNIRYVDISSPNNVVDAGFTTALPASATSIGTFENRIFIPSSSQDVTIGDLFVTDITFSPNITDRSPSNNPTPNTVQITYSNGPTQQTDTFNVFFVNIPPTASNPFGTVEVNETTDFSFPVNTNTRCIDADDGPSGLRYQILDLPQGVNYDNVTDMLAGNIPQGQYPIQWECTDLLNESATNTLLLQALGLNNNPNNRGSSNSNAVAIAVPVTILGFSCLLVIGFAIAGTIYKLKRPIVVTNRIDDVELGESQIEYKEEEFDYIFKTRISNRIGIPNWLEKQERERLFKQKRVVFWANPLEPLKLGVAGKGCFGWVLRGVDLKTLKPVVIKKVEGNAFEKSVGEDSLHKKAYRASTNKHDQVTEFVASFTTIEENISGLVLGDYNLGGANKVSNLLKNKGLEEHRPLLARVMIWQLLQQVKLMEEQGIWNRDFKPDNILCDAAFDPKEPIKDTDHPFVTDLCFRLADFGRGMEKPTEKVSVIAKFNGEKAIFKEGYGYESKGEFDWRYVPPETYLGPFTDGNLAGRFSLGKLYWEILTGNTTEDLSPRRLFCPQNQRLGEWGSFKRKAMTVSDYERAIKWGADQVDDEEQRNLYLKLMKVSPEERISPKKALKLPLFKNIEQDIEALKKVVAQLLPTKAEFEENEKVIEQMIKQKSINLSHLENAPVDPNKSNYPTRQNNDDEDYQNLNNSQIISSAPSTFDTRSAFVNEDRKEMYTNDYYNN